MNLKTATFVYKITICRLSFVFAVTLIALTITPFPTHAQENSVKIGTQIDSIMSIWDDPGHPGAAISVLKDGKIVFSKGYGSANLEYGVPIEPNSIFHVASVSKQFTVYAILLLEQDGKLSLDDDIRKHIPEVPDFGHLITLRHLASHTSGMRDQWNLLAMSGVRLDDVITVDHILKIVENQQELNFRPGEQYTYCNTGFTLLAEVVARISGKSFYEFTVERIFTPLDMKNTFFYDDHEKIVKNRAYSYYRQGEGYKKSVLSYANAGATSLFTTAEDLCIWANHLQDPGVESRRIVNKMNKEAVLNNGDTFGGALGQFVNRYKGIKQIQHGGADAGFRSYLGRFPEQKFAVAVVSNLANFNPNSVALQVADVFLADNYEEEEAQAEPVQRKYISLSNDELGAYTGHFWNEAGSYSRQIRIEDDTLRYDRGQLRVSPLIPFEKNAFQMLGVDVDIVVRFEENSGGKKMSVFIGEDDPVESDAYQPVRYLPPDLEEFTGEYYSPELGTTYTLVVKHNGLSASHRRTRDIRLNSIKKDLFGGNQWFFGLINFERSSNDKITGMRVSSGRVRNLYFKKI